MLKIKVKYDSNAPTGGIPTTKQPGKLSAHRYGILFVSKLPLIFSGDKARKRVPQDEKGVVYVQCYFPAFPRVAINILVDHWR